MNEFVKVEGDAVVLAWIRRMPCDGYCGSGTVIRVVTYERRLLVRVEDGVVGSGVPEHLSVIHGPSGEVDGETFVLDVPSGWVVDEPDTERWRNYYNEKTGYGPTMKRGADMAERLAQVVRVDDDIARALGMAGAVELTAWAEARARFREAL